MMKFAVIVFGCAVSATCLAQPDPATPQPSAPAPAPAPAEAPQQHPNFVPPGQQPREPLPPGRPFATDTPPGHADKAVPGRPFNSTDAQPSTPAPPAAAPSQQPRIGRMTSGPGEGAARPAGAMTNVAGTATNVLPGTASAIGRGMTNQTAVGSPANVSGTQAGGGGSGQGRAQLQASIASLQAGAITTQHREQLHQALVSSARGGQLPQDLVVRFVDDVTVHLPRARLSTQVQQQFVTFVETVLANPAQAEAHILPVRTLLVNSGLTPLAAQTIACDLHLLGTSLVATGTSAAPPAATPTVEIVNP